jgi:hypothetical protein
MCKVLFSSKGGTYGGFINKNGELKLALKDWYMLKDYWNGDFIEYKPYGAEFRVDKEGKWFKNRETTGYLVTENLSLINTLDHKESLFNTLYIYLLIF